MSAPGSIANVDLKAPTSVAPLVPMPKKPIWKSVVEIVVWQIAAILFVEAVLFCAGLGEEETFKFDPVVGFVHMPNKRITWRTEGFAQSYFDSDGMREPNLTVTKPANTYRIAFLGDSAVEAMQVPYDEQFGEVLGKKLGTVNGKRIQPLNFGISGYSTAQEYLQLKRQVLRYQPDLVVLCYNSRDMLENWTAPDQVITNVRPAALHLPGGGLAVESAQVERWFRSPRAKFLRSVDWFRQNSRIYGLFSAIDLEWSQNNPWYRAFIDFLGKPKKGIEQFKKLLTAQKAQEPAFQTATPAKAKVATADKDAGSSAHGAQTPAGVALGEKHEAMPETSYTKVVSKTLQSLFAEMRNESTKGGAKFAVISLPVRAELCPMANMETAFGTINYAQELDAVKRICATESIPYCNVEAAAESTLDQPKRESLFYVAHLAPAGHVFIADQIEQFIRAQIQSK